MNTIARRIAATAALAAAPFAVAIGIAAGANATPGPAAGLEPSVVSTNTISAPNPGTVGQGRSHPAQSWSARHRYNRHR